MNPNLLENRNLPPPPREPIPWIEWARQCGYRPESFAELFAVPQDQFNECFECIHCRTLPHWLFEARLWEAARLLCDGQETALVASQLEFANESEFEIMFLRYHGCSPVSFPRETCRIQEQELFQIAITNDCRINGSPSPLRAVALSEPEAGLSTTLSPSDRERDGVRGDTTCAKIHMFGRNEIPPDWAPQPGWNKAFRTLCQSAWAWPAGKSPREPGRRLLANLLQSRIGTGDSRALEALFNLLNDSVMKSLSWKFPRTDDSILWDAWTGAFLNDLQRFDLNRGELEQFLKLAACRNVQNSLSALKQRQRFECACEDTFISGAEAGPLCSIAFNSTKTPAESLEENDRLAEIEKQIEQFRAMLTAEESIIFNLQLQGEHYTEVFAEALGLSGWPPAEQLRKIRIIKDRIRKARERFHWRT
jgi:AraC-like DNA-binding protein